MDSLEQIIDILAWPITTIVVILLLRTPLSELVPTLKKLKYKDLEVEFEREAKNILAEAERDLPEIPEEKIKEEKKEPLILFRKQSTDPVTQVLKSWRDIELNLRKLAERHNIPSGKSIRSLVTSLESNKLITKQTSKIILDLSALRNKVVHTNEHIITYEFSATFNSSAKRAISALSEANNA